MGSLPSASHFMALLAAIRLTAEFERGFIPSQSEASWPIKRKKAFTSNPARGIVKPAGLHQALRSGRRTTACSAGANRLAGRSEL